MMLAEEIPSETSYRLPKSHCLEKGTSLIHAATSLNSSARIHSVEKADQLWEIRS